MTTKQAEPQTELDALLSEWREALEERGVVADVGEDEVAETEARLRGMPPGEAAALLRHALHRLRATR